MLGNSVGEIEGSLLGSNVGGFEGCALGTSVGSNEGSVDGDSVGGSVGGGNTHPATAAAPALHTTGHSSPNAQQPLIESTMQEQKTKFSSFT